MVVNALLEIYPPPPYPNFAPASLHNYHHCMRTYDILAFRLFVFLLWIIHISIYFYFLGRRSSCYQEIENVSKAKICRVFFFLKCQNWSSIKTNLSKLRYRGLVVCILLCEVCCFVTYLSFECVMPGLHVLYSRSKMLKLRKFESMKTLHQKNTHLWIFL